MPVKNIEEMKFYLEATITEGYNFLKDNNYDLDEINAIEDTEGRLEKLREIYVGLLPNKELSEKFKVITNLMNSLYQASKPEIFEYNWQNEYFVPLLYANGLFTNSIDDEKI